MEPYNWVSTGSITKFNRAVLEMKKKNKDLIAQGKPAEEITEEKLKARYAEMGGLVMPVDAPTVEEEAEEKPKKGRSSKDAE